MEAITSSMIAQKNVLYALVVRKPSTANRMKKAQAPSDNKSDSDGSFTSLEYAPTRKPNMGTIRLLNIIKDQVREPKVNKHK